MRKVYIVLFGLIIIFGVYLLFTQNQMKSNDIEYARTLVNSYEKANDISSDGEIFPEPVVYRDMIISFDQNQSVLIAKAFVAGTWWKAATETNKENFYKVAKGLTDQDLISGYDMGGGVFEFDPENGFYLVRRFPLNETTSASFTEDLSHLFEIAAKWRVEWFFGFAKKINNLPSSASDVKQSFIAFLNNEIKKEKEANPPGTKSTTYSESDIECDSNKCKVKLVVQMGKVTSRGTVAFKQEGGIWMTDIDEMIPGDETSQVD